MILGQDELGLKRNVHTLMNHVARYEARGKTGPYISASVLKEADVDEAWNVFGL